MLYCTWYVVDREHTPDGLSHFLSIPQFSCFQKSLMLLCQVSINTSLRLLLLAILATVSYNKQFSMKLNLYSSVQRLRCSM